MLPGVPCFLVALVCCFLCVASLDGCSGLSPTHKPSAPPPAVSQVAAPRVVGRVALVNDKLAFVLIDIQTIEYPSVGIALKTFRDGNETSILSVSPERNSPFIIADIVKGAPQKGDLVYE